MPINPHYLTESSPRLSHRGVVSDFGIRPANFARASKTNAPPVILPAVSPLLLRWFTWYSRGYVRRHFHSLRLSLSGLPPCADGMPLVIYSNHASWWDPLVCLVLKAELFPDRSSFAPIDAVMLERYRFFRRLGFFGVDRSSRKGATQFLRTADAILESPGHLLAITPQNAFADVRQRPIHFASGLGRLAARGKRVCFVPVALEYVFWEERLPEILVRFGNPHYGSTPDSHQPEARAWTAIFETELAETQNELAREAQRRRPQDFHPLLLGGAGPGGIYDLWRAFSATLTGQNFAREHGHK
jgi:1-acyl-sn-glycerol-3-phosphate acyltransferase